MSKKREVLAREGQHQHILPPAKYDSNEISVRPNHLNLAEVLGHLFMSNRSCQNNLILD
jgi:hypothetical protein